MDKLNIGCGGTMREGWTNVDLHEAEGVTAVDITKGLPFAESSYDLIYASHVLEHLAKWQALQFLGDCLKVLRPGGTIRIVVPDLEQICRIYINKLSDFRNGQLSEGEYDWIMLELFDQLIRTGSGGAMISFARAADANTKAFIEQRLGAESATWFAPESSPGLQNQSFVRRMGRSVKSLIRRVQAWLAGISPDERTELLFRRSGELHRWMYDEFSLGRLLTETAFVDVTRRSATDSYIDDWSKETLDTDDQGITRKPDSLFMEAKKKLL